MGYEHLSTTPETDIDEVIKSSAKNLLPIPSEYEVTFDDESECDVPIKDDSSLAFTTYSNPLFDDNNDFTSSDDESLPKEDVPIEEFKELSEYINSPSWNYPTFYDDDEEHSVQYKEYLEKSSNATTPVLPTEEPKYSLSMGYENLSTTPETESNEIIKSGVEKLVPIPSEYEVTSEDKNECDVPVCEDSSTFDVCEDHSEILSDSNEDDISSDDNAFEDIEYVEASTLDSELVSLEDENDSFASFPIFEESDNSLSISDNSSPEFETFSDHTEDTRSGGTTTHANNSLLEYDSFCFEIEPNSGEVISAVINNIDELNEDECFDPGGEIDVFANVEDDDCFPFIFVIRIFIPYLIYPEVSHLLLSAKSEDTIFDPGISI
nr:hypothetical protein [Tanacetum cinerariifolium]